MFQFKIRVQGADKGLYPAQDTGVGGGGGWKE